MKKQYWACGIAVGAAILVAAPANAQSIGKAATGPEQSSYDAGYSVTGTTPHAFSSVESHWTQPKVDCTGINDGSIGINLGLDSAKGGYSAELSVEGSCDNAVADYSAYSHIGPQSQPVNYSVQPGDKFDAKISSDGAGNFTFYLADETQKWNNTAKQNAPTSTASGAHAVLQGFGANADPGKPLPKFAPVTITGTQVNGKPIASLTPTKSVLVDNNKKTVIDTSDIDAQGAFTVTQQG